MEVKGAGRGSEGVRQINCRDQLQAEEEQRNRGVEVEYVVVQGNVLALPTILSCM